MSTQVHTGSGTRGSVQPSAARIATAIGCGFVAMLVSGSLIAMAMNPLVGPMFGSLVRDPERQGLQVPSLLSGYLVIVIVLTWVLIELGRPSTWKGAKTGLVLGLGVFLGDHLVTAGWSVLPVTPMAVSGALDALAGGVGGLVLAKILRGAQNKGA